MASSLRSPLIRRCRQPSQTDLRLVRAGEVPPVTWSWIAWRLCLRLALVLVAGTVAGLVTVYLLRGVQ